MNFERTISIRKVVHIAKGVVGDCKPTEVDSLRRAVNITCTITVDVPVLTESFRCNDDRLSDEQYDIVYWLQEHDFEPEDEIGILASALPERCPFRKRTGAVVYVRAQQRMLDQLIAERYAGTDIQLDAASSVLGLNEDGGFTFVEGDTPVVVRVRDVLYDYALPEDK